jgi:hypothetical protein
MATIYWTGTSSGCLTDPGNWDLNRLPTGADDVIVADDAYCWVPGDDPLPGAVTARSVTVTNAGIIAGGVWNGPVTAPGAASLGDSSAGAQPTFNGSVTVGSALNSSVSIYRGVFNAGVDCYGAIVGGTFYGLVRLLGAYCYMRPLHSIVLADRLQIGSGPVLYADVSPMVAPPSQVRSGVPNCGSTGSYVGMVMARARLGM